MAIDFSDDLDVGFGAPANPSNPAPTKSSSPRTLLLAPPSLAAHEEKLRDVFQTFDRSTTDLQMLDRLSVAPLPAATYQLVLVLTDVDGSRRTEALALLTREACAKLFQTMKVGGALKAQDGALEFSDAREAVLAGLVTGSGGFVKPDDTEGEAVPLRLLKRKPAQPTPAAPPPPPKTALELLEDDDDDDDLIDEEGLIDADGDSALQAPPECAPKVGKKRRACKDCTCGLAERLAQKADKKKALLLKSEELNELDFTVKGKTGSCGNCSLGDAFRCAGCPYLGLPRFEPGQEVTILNNVAQL